MRIVSDWRVGLPTSKVLVVTLLLLLSGVMMGCDETSQSSENDVVSDYEVRHTEQETVNNTEMALQSPTNTSTDRSITILALGDSLTEGYGLAQQDAYPAQLQVMLADRGYTQVEVVNAGLAGETSSGLVNRLDWVLNTNPDITILTTGANDAMRGIDPSLIKENIHQAIERLTTQGSEVILSGMQIYENLGEQYVEEFSGIYPELANELDVALIPYFLQGVGGNAVLNQADRIHPTKEGYEKIIENNILPVLTPILEDVVTQSGQDEEDTI